MAPPASRSTGADAHRGRLRWWALLALAAILSAILPAPHLPLRIQRSAYAGPDLLAEEAPVSRTVGREPLIPGLLSRVERRVTQDGRLLREERVMQLSVPVPLLVFAVVWVGARMAAPRGQPRSSATPETSRSTSSSDV